jgi:hypothetical protein
MIRGWLRRCLGLVLLSASAFPVWAEVDERPICPARDIEASLYNPDGDLSRRQEALATLVADSGKRGEFGWYRHTRYLVGSLYRLGREHPAALVDRDLDKAKLLLSHAALEGSLRAMASMAEAELSDGDAMSAMVWAQVYAHYMRKYSSHRGSDTYAADLLDRAYARVGRTSAAQRDITQYVNAFVATHGPKIESAFSPKADGRTWTPTCRPLNDVWPLKQVKGDDKIARIRGDRSTRSKARPGIALFEIWVNPEGGVVKALVIDSLPDRVTAEILRDSVEALRFNAVAPDAPLRPGMVPVSFNDHSISLPESD